MGVAGVDAQVEINLLELAKWLVLTLGGTAWWVSLGLRAKRCRFDSHPGGGPGQ